MKNYYCPYCNPKYQFHKKTKTGEFVCGLCGDILVKKPFIKVKQIVAIVASLSFLLPLIYSFLFLIRNQINPQRKNYKVSINLDQLTLNHKTNQPLHSDFFKHE